MTGRAGKFVTVDSLLQAAVGSRLGKFLTWLSRPMASEARPLSPALVEFYQDQIADLRQDFNNSDSSQDKQALASVIVSCCLRLCGVE